MATTVETPEQRKTMVSDAGIAATSFTSILAGTLTGFGALVLLLAAVGAIGGTLGLSTEGISSEEWREAGIAGAAGGALLIFVSWFFGGYTAGRMARRAGLRHGLLAFLLGVVVVAAIAGVTALYADPVVLGDELAGEGVPTDAGTWADVGIGAGIAAVVAMLAGSILGGIRGEHWHGRLATAVAGHDLADDRTRSIRPRRRPLHADHDGDGKDRDEVVDLDAETEERSRPTVEEERTASTKR